VIEWGAGNSSCFLARGQPYRGLLARSSLRRRTTWHTWALLGGSLKWSAPILFSSVARAFKQGLHDLGYVEGQNLLHEWRSAEGNMERLPVTQAARAATAVVPIWPFLCRGVSSTRFVHSQDLHRWRWEENFAERAHPIIGPLPRAHAPVTKLLKLIETP